VEQLVDPPPERPNSHFMHNSAHTCPVTRR
jgi:hypothetical protein